MLRNIDLISNHHSNITKWFMNITLNILQPKYLSHVWQYLSLCAKSPTFPQGHTELTLLRNSRCVITIMSNQAALSLLCIHPSGCQIGWRGTVETLYNTINFCWSTHKRHSIARPKGRGMGCLLWVQRATYCVDLSILSSIKNRAIKGLHCIAIVVSVHT